MTTRANYYSDTAHEFLIKARAHLAEGDLRQASEKGWGAAAQMVKAVAEERGWQHKTHADLFQIVGRLAELSADEELRPRFLSANALHQNFYEGDMLADMVAAGIHEVEQFAAALEPHLA